MSDWNEAFVVVRGERFHFYRSGGHKPPLVMAHGFTDSGWCWTAVAASLRERYDIILPDARGHGLSARLPLDKTTDMVDDMAGFFHALGLRQVALLGHSMGAATSSGVAAREPDLVAALVLEDPPWWAPDAPRPPAGPYQFPAQIGKDPAELLPILRAQNPTFPENEIQLLAVTKPLLDPALATAKRAEVPWLETVPKLRCPGLLVTGDPKLGALVTPEVARRVLSLWPSGRLASIAGAGHGIHREQPAAFLKAVGDFLAEQYPSQ